MAPVGKKAIQHFSHPGHILSELKAETLFLCDGCKTPGQGTRPLRSPQASALSAAAHAAPGGTGVGLVALTFISNVFWHPCDPPKQRQAPPPWGPSCSAPPPPPHYRAPPWGPSPPPPPYQAPPRGPLPAAAYGGQYVPDGVPWGYNANYNMYGNGNLQPQREGNPMYAVVGKLVFGVVSNIIFGTPGIDFSSFL
ncbi:hypothetical protein Acr_02g0008770 [Actinidia rufa]|uniref:Uncharacterized protein n=1 Tax=Actinidia rufa TaxID=165716 RepID=A0A7J0EAG6_9ERIC|nr:hypothetical protein Acr_02g0008770 [Actinidia rufa]